MRKRMLKALFTTLILLSISVSALAAEYWGSAKSNKYHYQSCRWAQKIKPSNLVVFKSPEEAAKAGYVPCKVCQPPSSPK